MPNIVAHTFITCEVLSGNNPDVVLGSVLPDFVGMYNDQRGGRMKLLEIGGEALRAGIAFHQMTDSAYDGTPLKATLNTAMEGDLTITEMSRFAKRRCADHGTEILLDGHLLGYRPAAEAFLRLAELVVAGETELDDSTSDRRFVDFVKNYFAHGIPKAYVDPKAVAEMWQHRLAVRSKLHGRNLGFAAKEIPDVANAFRAQIDRLKKCGAQLLEQTIQNLASRD